MRLFVSQEIRQLPRKIRQLANQLGVFLLEQREILVAVPVPRNGQVGIGRIFKPLQSVLFGPRLQGGFRNPQQRPDQLAPRKGAPFLQADQLV